jgi:hypothetical protein
MYSCCEELALLAGHIMLVMPLAARLSLPLPILETWISAAKPTIDQACIGNAMDLSPDYDSVDTYASNEPG